MCLLYQCIRQSLLYVILSATRKHQPNIVLDTLQYNVVFLQGSFTVFFFFFFFERHSTSGFSATFHYSLNTRSCKLFKCMLKTLFGGSKQYQIVRKKQTVDRVASSSDTLTIRLRLSIQFL